MRLPDWARGLAYTGATIGLLLGLWILTPVPRGESALLTEASGALSLSSMRATFSTTYTLFLPLVLSGYTPPAPTIFGVQMYGALNTTSAGLPLASEARVYWVRWPLSWAAVEPTDTLPEYYNFSVYDTSILSATQAGLHPIVTVLSAPAWAATYTNGPIDKVDIGEFTEFMGALAERYDGDGWEDAPGSPVVDYWEFYNEPDAGDRLRAEYGASYWGHFGDEYARMLCAIYPVIRAANPRVQIVLGGLAYDSFEDQGGGFVREFLDDVLAAGGGQCFDFMNFHYYPPFAPVWAPYGAGLSGKANYLRMKLQQYGWADKPMMVTEAGWHSDAYSQFPSTPEIQAQYVVKLFVQSLASHLQTMIWWTWIDPGGYYGANGLLTQGLERKPAYFTYQAAVAKLGPATFKEIWASGDPAVEGYRFSSQSGEPLYVLWANDDVTRTVSLSVSQAQVIDLYGEITAQLSDGGDGQVDGHVQVTVGANPIYVEAMP